MEFFQFWDLQRFGDQGEFVILLKQLASIFEKKTNFISKTTMDKWCQN